MKTRKLKIAISSALLASGLMLSSCGVDQFVSDIVSEVVESATGFAWDEMGGGERVRLAEGDLTGAIDLRAILVNNAISIQHHNQNNVVIEYSPPTRGQYTTPTAQFVDGSGHIHIAEERSNIVIGGNNQPGVVFVYLPQGMDPLAALDIQSTNGGARITGSGQTLAHSVEIGITNGMVNLQSFAAQAIAVTNTNGTIVADDIATDADTSLRTTNGTITLRNSSIQGDLTARTTNGVVTVENVEFDLDNADIRATNGTVNIR